MIDSPRKETALLEAARRGSAAGKSVEEAVRLEALPGFEDHEAPSPRLSLQAALRAAWEELAGRRLERERPVRRNR